MYAVWDMNEDEVHTFKSLSYIRRYIRTLHGIGYRFAWIDRMSQNGENGYTVSLYKEG